jgi:CheY-like chemotaxis protein
MARILIVEDEANLAKGLLFNLKAEGHEVSVAGDGETALETIRREPFDAVVLDVMLPGKDGFEVASALRAEGNFVPVLMLTARARSQDLRWSPHRLRSARIACSRPHRASNPHGSRSAALSHAQLPAHRLS